jgi:hypothetical protein
MDFFDSIHNSQLLLAADGVQSPPIWPNEKRRKAHGVGARAEGPEAQWS